MGSLWAADQSQVTRFQEPHVERCWISRIKWERTTAWGTTSFRTRTGRPELTGASQEPEEQGLRATFSVNFISKRQGLAGDNINLALSQLSGAYVWFIFSSFWGKEDCIAFLSLLHFWSVSTFVLLVPEMAAKSSEPSLGS